MPVINLAELREQIGTRIPALTRIWQTENDDTVLLAGSRNANAVYMPAAGESSFDLDVVSRYSMYREGMWARASELLTAAGGLHALGSVLAHPDTLATKGLRAGENVVKTFLGESSYFIETREDVCPGVLFVAKRGAAGDLSDVDSATIGGGL